MTAAANSPGYPSFFMAGMVMPPMADAVATPEPEMAPKRPEARTVTMALRNRPGAGTEAVEAQFARFRAGWQTTLDKAREHGNTRNIVVEETKLSALEDIIAHFREVEK